MGLCTACVCMRVCMRVRVCVAAIVQQVLRLRAVALTARDSCGWPDTLFALTAATDRPYRPYRSRGC